MEVIFGIAIVLVAIMLGIGFLAETADVWWPVVRSLIFLGIGIWVFALMWRGAAAARLERKREMEAARQKRLAEARKAEEVAQANARRLDAERAARERQLERVFDCVETAKQRMAEIPEHLAASESAISRARDRFVERSYYPFWDCVGDAVESLHEYELCIDMLGNTRDNYYQNIIEYKKLPGSDAGRDFPSFPVSSASNMPLRTGAETAVRIQSLYDVAHRDYEFSNIYANWRTNKTLVAGFKSLSGGLSAIRNELSGIDFTLRQGFDSVVDGLDSVNNSVQSGAKKISSAIDRGAQDTASRLERSLGEIRSSAESHSAASARQLTKSRESQMKNEIEMIRLLDNIQRGREDLPGLSDIGKAAMTRKLE